jgi:hypothetical protein
LNSRKILAKIIDKWPAKVLSVAAALVLLMFHRMTTQEIRYFSTVLQIEISDDFIPTGSFTQLVRVNMRGNVNGIYSIIEDDIEAYIDLRRYTTEGWIRVPVQVRKKGSALNVEPLEILVDPMEISLQLERRVSRSIPISPVFQGEIAGGFEIVSYSLTPQTVTVEGPRSSVETLASLNTGTIDMTRRDRNFSLRVNIINNNPLLIVRGSGITEFNCIIQEIHLYNNYNVENIAEDDFGFFQDPDRQYEVPRQELSRPVLEQESIEND